MSGPTNAVAEPMPAAPTLRRDGLTELRARFPGWNVFRSNPSKPDVTSGFYATRSYEPVCDPAAPGSGLAATVAASTREGLADAITAQIAQEKQLASQTGPGGAR
jgi:hypothetical protein